MKRLLPLFLTVLALSWTVPVNAKVKRHELSISNAIEVGTVNLKPGTYQLAMEDNQLLVYHDNKELAKVPVQVQQLNAKNRDTEVVYKPGGKVEEVRLEGESCKLVLSN